MYEERAHVVEASVRGEEGSVRDEEESVHDEEESVRGEEESVHGGEESVRDVKERDAFPNCVEESMTPHPSRLHLLHL